MRADQQRRQALAAIANLGATGRDGIERFRMVIYLTGDQKEHAADIARCEAFAKAEDWEVVTVRSDPDDSQWAWMRMGLLSTITMVAHMQADGVLMPQSVFDALSTDDCSFLFGRLNRWGGFLRTVADEDENPAVSWQVRYTWEPLDSTPHPRLTYGEARDEDAATGQALSAIARQRNSHYLRLVEVHIRPVNSNDWTKVQEPAQPEARPFQ